MSFGWTSFHRRIFHRPVLRSRTSRRAWLTTRMLFGVMMLFSLAGGQQKSQSADQGAHYERSFSQSKVKIEKALKELQTSLSGRLPTLDGFAVQGAQPLTRYQ